QEEDQEEDESETGEVSSEEEQGLRSALDDILGDEAEEEDVDPFADSSEEDVDRQSTRVFNVEEMQQVKSERQKAEVEDDDYDADLDGRSRSDDATQAGDADRDKVEWYAAVDEKQIGPMSLAEFAEHFEEGQYDGETLVWKAGFDEWLPAYEVAEFQFVVDDEEDSDSHESPDEPKEEEEAQGPDDESAWRFDGDDESASGAEGFPSDESDFGDDETAADDGYFDEGEESSSASDAAFAGADVDWKPSALSSLSSLAEEELSSMKPVDPEPEEDEFPFPEEDAVPEDGEVSMPMEAEDDDEPEEEEEGSLIGQIAAEEEAAAEEAERERLERERIEEEARKKAEEDALAAQQAASREQYEERRERAAPPEEQFIPGRAGVNPQMKMLVLGGGLALFVMFATTIGVVIWATSKDDVPAPNPQVMQPVAGPGAQSGVQPG
ncbi:MAG: DUF4339 domain-containing protein, partial [Lentisphaeria bacterium]|nr:DUF4339 domain-containing protein [Lentisphaeria bacterium]